jgi:Bacterial low temperature requirement A protein (LtrA)
MPRALGVCSGGRRRRRGDPALVAWPWPTRRSQTDIAGEHLFERFRLFFLIVLGESVLTAGNALTDERFEVERLLALAIGFTGTVALWWCYFRRTEAIGIEVAENAADAGGVGQWATWTLMLMVLALIGIAVGDELEIARPGDEVTLGFTILTFGGPALFLLAQGHSSCAMCSATTMTPSSSLSARRWSISTVPSCVYPSSICRTFAWVHGRRKVIRRRPRRSDRVLPVTSFRLCAWRNPSQVDVSRRSAGGAAVPDLSGEPPAVSAGQHPAAW